MWEKIKGWFRNSLTIFWARLNWFIGVIGAGLVATFSGYNFNDLVSMDWKSAFKLLAWAALLGVVTEFARRRTLGKDDQ